jgi:hypothetical protein
MNDLIKSKNLITEYLYKKAMIMQQQKEPIFEEQIIKIQRLVNKVDQDIKKLPFHSPANAYNKVLDFLTFQNLEVFD